EPVSLVLAEPQAPARLTLPVLLHVLSPLTGLMGGAVASVSTPRIVHASKLCPAVKGAAGSGRSEGSRHRSRFLRRLRQGLGNPGPFLEAGEVRVPDPFAFVQRPVEVGADVLRIVRVGGEGDRNTFGRAHLHDLRRRVQLLFPPSYTRRAELD